MAIIGELRKVGAEVEAFDPTTCGDVVAAPGEHRSQASNSSAT